MSNSVFSRWAVFCASTEEDFEFNVFCATLGVNRAGRTIVRPGGLGSSKLEVVQDRSSEVSVGRTPAPPPLVPRSPEAIGT